MTAPAQSREIRAVIADDEAHARRGVRQLLAAHGDIRVVGEAGDGRSAARMVATLKPDLLLLDIQMPELHGFDVLQRGPQAVPAVVFVTAYERFARRAFDVEATDYLVKPLSRSRFDAAMQRVRQRVHALRAPAASTARDGDSLVVPTERGEHVLRFAEIDWIAASDYRAAVYALGRRFLVRMPLTDLARQLPSDSFMRVHRSAIVNLSRVRELETDGEGARVILLDGSSVPVSRRMRASVARWIRSVGVT